MTVLVTGGAGFIGAYVVRDLLAAGRRVVVFDRAPDDNALGLVLEGDEAPTDVVEGDICDGKLLRRLCAHHDVEHIVHLASPLTKDVDGATTIGLRDICVGTSTVFDVAADCAIKRVVWTSSVAVFGPSDGYPPGPLADDAAHRPATLYGRAKSMCEAVAEHASKTRGIDIVGLRLSVVYGAGRLRGYMSYASHLVRQAALGGPVAIVPGRQRLNWQYVEEVSATVMHLLDSLALGGGRTFNCHGIAGSYGDAGRILGQLRADLDVVIGDEFDGALAGVVDEYDDRIFNNLFSYTPRWSLEDGLRTALDTYERMLSHGPATGVR